jgi:cell division protein FtsL
MSEPSQQSQQQSQPDEKPAKSVSAFRLPEKILLGIAAAFALAILWNVLNGVFGWVEIRPF